MKKSTKRKATQVDPHRDPKSQLVKSYLFDELLRCEPLAAGHEPPMSRADFVEAFVSQAREEISFYADSPDQLEDWLSTARLFAEVASLSLI